jgi:hypothetical protein
MQTKVTKSDYQELMNFCKKKGVDFIDLRLEVADHLANAIEDLWKVKPELSFNQALDVEYKKFGIYGFTDVIEDHSNQMVKSYTRKLWQGIQALLTIRNSVFILLVGLFMYQMMESFEWARNAMVVVIYIVILAGPTLITLRFFQNKYVFKGEKVMLLSTPIQFLVWVNWGLVYMFDLFSFSRINEPYFAIQLTLFFVGLVLNP